MDSKKPLYKSVSFWIMVLFLLYSALGFLAVPYYLKNKLTEIVKNQLNSVITVKNIAFNPYTIAVDITDLNLTDTDGTQWFKAENLHVNLNLWITIFSHYSLSKIHLENPQYHLVVNDSNKEIQIKYPQLNMQDKETNSSELELDINDLSINKGAIFYIDGLNKQELNLKFVNIQLKQTAFSTQDRDTPFDLSFITESNHSAKISGIYNFTKTQVKADWKIGNWQTKTLFKFLANADNRYLGLSNHSGIINAYGKLHYSESLVEDSSVVIQQLVLNEFNSSATDEKALKIAIPQLTVTKAEVNFNQQHIIIDNIKTTQNEINIGLGGNNELLWKPQLDQPSNDTSNGGWMFTLKSLTLEDSNINILKSAGRNVLHLTQINIQDFSTSKGQKAKLEINGTIDQSGQIQTQAQLQLSPLMLTSELQLKDINLAKWQAWIPNNIHIKLQKGQLSTQQFITVNEENINSQGWVKLQNTVLVDDTNHEFFSIRELLIEKNNVNFNDKSIELDTIVLDHAQGDLLVSQDKTLNLSNMISDGGDISNESDAKPWKVSIGSVELNNAQTSITDKSVKPNYHSKLSQIKGSIKGLSSQDLTKADVRLSGVIDTYGQLSITGQINPLSEQAFTDLTININNLDMQSFSSYSSHYLGFPLQRGKADFSLHYKLNKYILKGKNNLIFKQLKFGDKTNNADAINLPLKLAVNLLTDGNGVMKINLPVRGNINDPTFSYGGLVFKAFFKLITGIVASPFKLLAKLIPNAADLDLSGIQFNAGMTELKAGEETKLQVMQEIMQKRPKLNLELTSVINSIEDEKVLKKQQLLKQLKLTHTPELADLNSIKKAYITMFNQQEWQQLVAETGQDQQLNQEQILEKAWKQLIEAQNVNEWINHLSMARAQFIQTQLIDQLSVPKERIFIRSSETSETQYPQVKFGISGL